MYHPIVLEALGTLRYMATRVGDAARNASNYVLSTRRRKAVSLSPTALVFRDGRVPATVDVVTRVLERLRETAVLEHMSHSDVWDLFSVDRGSALWVVAYDGCCEFCTYATHLIHGARPRNNRVVVFCVVPDSDVALAWVGYLTRMGLAPNDIFMHVVEDEDANPTVPQISEALRLVRPSDCIAVKDIRDTRTPTFC